MGAANLHKLLIFAESQFLGTDCHQIYICFLIFELTLRITKDFNNGRCFDEWLLMKMSLSLSLFVLRVVDHNIFKQAWFFYAFLFKFCMFYRN